jgi:hypothetical protein
LVESSRLLDYREFPEIYREAHSVRGNPALKQKEQPVETLWIFFEQSGKASRMA